MSARFARFAVSAAAGAFVASIVEATFSTLQPPRPEGSGHVSLVFVATAAASAILQIPGIAAALAVLFGLEASPRVRAGVRRTVRALRGDDVAGRTVLARAASAFVFGAVAVPAFFGVAAWSVDGIVTTELRAPFVAIVDLAVVVGAAFVARASAPLGTFVSRRIPRASRAVRALAAACVVASAIGLALGWDFVQMLDARLVAVGAAIGTGLGVARGVFARLGVRPVSRVARVSAIASPVLLAAAAIAATIVLAGTSAASFDASVRSASAAAVVGVVRPREAGGVVASPASRVRAAVSVSLAAGTPVPRHLVVLTIDALRADHLGCYGWRRRPTSPVLDRIARRAALFEEAHAQSPASLRSIPSAFMGLYPHAIPFLRAEAGRVMPAPSATRPLADLLRARGFRTMAVLHTRYIHNPGIIQGFDEVIVDPREGDTRARWKQLRAERFVDQAIGALERNPPGDRRLFFWMHFIEPHGPYNPVPDFPWGRGDEQKYEAEIRYTDRALGRFLEALDRLGIARDALFVLFADHGEEFGEHGATAHGTTLYRAGTHVPLLFWGSGVRPGRHAREVGLVDVLPTVLGMLRVPTPWVHGSTLAGTITTGRPPPVRTIASELFPKGLGRHTLIAAQREGWKLIADPDLQPREVFRVADDPLEKRNLVLARPVVREALRADLAAIGALASRPERRAAPR